MSRWRLCEMEKKAHNRVTEDPVVRCSRWQSVWKHSDGQQQLLWERGVCLIHCCCASQILPACPEICTNSLSNCAAATSTAVYYTRMKTAVIRLQEIEALQIGKILFKTKKKILLKTRCWPVLRVHPATCSSAATSDECLQVLSCCESCREMHFNAKKRANQAA